MKNVNLCYSLAERYDIISDVIWNTNGEKRPENLTVEGYSDDYVVKYWTGTH